MKETYTVEMYHTERNEVKRIEVEASPLELDRIAGELLRGATYDGVRILRVVNRPQVVEILNYRKEGGRCAQCVAGADAPMEEWTNFFS